MDLLEEIQLRSSQEEQQAQNRCSLLSQSATVYTAETPSLLSNWTHKKNNNRDHYNIHISVPSQLPLTKSNDTFNVSSYTEWIFRCIRRLVITRAHIQSCVRWKNMIIEKKYIKKICHFRGRFSKQILKGQTSHILYASMMEEFHTCNGKKEIKKNLIVQLYK